MCVSSDLCSSWCKQYNQTDGELASSSQDDTNDAGLMTLGSQQQIAVVSAAVGEPNSEAATATAAWFTAVM